MRKNQLAAQKAVSRDLTAIALPTRLPLKRIIALLQDLTFQALKTGNTDDIEKVCQKQLLELLDANTEVAVLKGGRRGQLSAEKVIDEPVQEIMPVRLSLEDSGSIQAQGTAAYLKRISGIDPSEANNAFKRQNAVLIRGLSTEICDTIRKTIADLTKQGVHVKGGKQEIANILMNAGLDPAAAPRLAETIFRTQTAAAYNAGRWNIVNDPDTAPYIWGFEYCTAHDRRVRPEHRLLEGVRLPKDDPFWKKYLPPNGWNCRCTVLEIWNDEDIAKVDFGITGVDPRKRTDKELNLLPAFAGNAGVLAAGRGNNGNGSAEASKNPSRATRPNTGQIRAPKEWSNTDKKKQVRKIVIANKLAVRIIDKLSIDRLTVPTKVQVICESAIVEGQQGWIFKANISKRVAIYKINDIRYVVVNGTSSYEVNNLQDAFIDVRRIIAKAKNVKPEEVGFVVSGSLCDYTNVKELYLQKKKKLEDILTGEFIAQNRKNKKKGGSPLVIFLKDVPQNKSLSFESNSDEIPCLWEVVIPKSMHSEAIIPLGIFLGYDLRTKKWYCDGVGIKRISYDSLAQALNRIKIDYSFMAGTDNIVWQWLKKIAKPIDRDAHDEKLLELKRESYNYIELAKEDLQLTKKGKLPIDQKMQGSNKGEKQIAELLLNMYSKVERVEKNGYTTINAPDFRVEIENIVEFIEVKTFNPPELHGNESDFKQSIDNFVEYIKDSYHQDPDVFIINMKIFFNEKKISSFEKQKSIIERIINKLFEYKKASDGTVEKVVVPFDFRFWTGSRMLGVRKGVYENEPKMFMWKIH